jgi:hypothetical protein
VEELFTKVPNGFLKSAKNISHRPNLPPLRGTVYGLGTFFQIGSTVSETDSTMNAAVRSPLREHGIGGSFS